MGYVPDGFDQVLNDAYHRFWGGIHPPIDDIPGREIGKQIGPMAFNHTFQYFEETA